MNYIIFETSEGNLEVPEGRCPIGVVLDGDLYDFHKHLYEIGEFSSGVCMTHIMGKDYEVLGMVGHVLVVDDPKYTLG